MAQRDESCLALAMRDRGGNPPVDEAADARQKNGGSSPDSRRGRGVGGGVVEHRHGYFLRKGWRSPNRTMAVAALQNFEKTTIYSPDALDMFLTSRFSGSEVRCRDAG
jgi:hypothetical protein